MDAPRAKVCGLTSVADAELAAELGAWAIGLIFHPASPRRVGSAEAQRIAAAVRRRVLVAGVFVNQPLERIAALHERVGFELVQLHGDEGPAFCAEAARRTGARVIKAAPVSDAGDVQALDAYRAVDFHLVDGRAPGRRGGTGRAVDPALLRGRRSTVPLILSGGLTPENVAAAIAAVRPYAVDSASGTEVEPGRKDPDRLAAFLDAVRAAAGAPA